MSISNYLENKLLDTLRAQSFSVTTVYAQLHTGNPGEDCTANVATENTRVSLSWNAASGGSMATSATASWTNVAATETLTHFSLWDAATSGNALFYGSLSASASVVAGDNFDLDTVTLTLD